MKSLAPLFAAIIPLLVTAPRCADAQELRAAISGSVGVPGVTMKGMPGDPLTDTNGDYSGAIPQGWSGTVTPVKEGFIFEPPSRKYAGIQAWRKDEDYVAKMITFTITGNVGAPGVVMEGLPGDPISDDKGVYRVEVAYKWQGVVKPELPGYVFAPPFRTYPPVIKNYLKEDYIATPGEATGSLYRSSEGRRGPRAGVAPSPARDVLVVPTAGVDTAEFTEMADDMRVMLQILREKANEQRAWMGRTVLPDYGPIFGQGGPGSEALYIQGHAVVFVMEVNFSVDVGQEPNTANPAGPQRESDQVWQRAKERLGQNDSSGAMTPPNPTQLKENLIRALRHAANIRHLDPNELVILTVIGSSRPTPRSGGGSYGATSVHGGGYFYGASSFNTDDASGSSGSGGYTSLSTRGGRRVPEIAVPAGSSGGDWLIIQAKTADINAFAGDKISFEQFNQRVKVFNY